MQKKYILYSICLASVFALSEPLSAQQQTTATQQASQQQQGRTVKGTVVDETGLAIIGSLMVSYVRARAEGLGLECKVGLMQRPERVVLTALGAIFAGVFQRIELFDPMYILIAPLAIIAVLANWTAFVRINHCRKLLSNQQE